MSFTHYYGDIVRKLFLVGGATMLVILPFLRFFIPFPIFVSILAILVVGFFAGVIVPTQRWAIIMNACVGAFAFVAFEYYAVDAYGKGNEVFFLANQFLAIDFFVAFYFAIKTVRGSFVHHKKETPDDFAIDILKD